MAGSLRLDASLAPASLRNELVGVFRAGSAYIGAAASFAQLLMRFLDMEAVSAIRKQVSSLADDRIVGCC